MIKKRKENKERNNIMKSIKLIILVATISLFTLFPYDMANARDCSNPKGFHEKMMCKLSGEDSPGEKPAKDPNSLWQKIKNFGGKNIGETG